MKTAKCRIVAVVLLAFLSIATSASEGRAGFVVNLFINGNNVLSNSALSSFDGDYSNGPNTFHIAGSSATIFSSDPFSDLVTSVGSLSQTAGAAGATLRIEVTYQGFLMNPAGATQLDGSHSAAFTPQATLGTASADYFGDPANGVLSGTHIGPTSGSGGSAPSGNFTRVGAFSLANSISITLTALNAPAGSVSVETDATNLQPNQLPSTPEPASILLAISGCGICGLFARKRLRA